MYSFKKLGVSVTTYSGEHTPPHRYAMINNCFETLAAVPDVLVNIISDGLTPRHRKLIEGYPQFNHVERAENGGVARAKNTSIRTLLEQGVDIGFLADDDLIFKDKHVFTAYATAIIKTGIPHFCFYQEDKIAQTKLERHESIEIRNVNGLQIKKTPLVMGPFITFTPSIIEKIGYFRVFDYKFGHEHSNFTIRCLKNKLIPHFCDLINLQELLEIDVRSLAANGHSLEINRDGVEQNGREYLTRLAEYFPIIE